MFRNTIIVLNIWFKLFRNVLLYCQKYVHKHCHHHYFVTLVIYQRSCVSGLLPNEEGLQTAVTPPSSPLQILKEADNQWLNSEVWL
jgi:hypothetical protein